MIDMNDIIIVAVQLMVFTPIIACVGVLMYEGYDMFVKKQK